MRAILVWPLYVHHEHAAGQKAYVMADGHAYPERLRAAADLYHMHRVQEIFILDERAPSHYNFVKQKMSTQVENAIGFLEHLGVPRKAIQFIEEPQGHWLSSLAEAQSMSAHLQDNADRLVIVTSAPHTRRSLLCFQRSMPAKVVVQVYSASGPLDSAELYAPIWQEYVKLAVYFFAA